MSDRDADVLGRIHTLVDEEHRLRGDGAGHGPDAARLRQVEEELDQCWDLLRQRQARREFDQDPDGAEVRPTSTVENYQQ
jgi:hypothetical protein